MVCVPKKIGRAFRLALVMFLAAGWLGAVGGRGVFAQEGEASLFWPAPPDPMRVVFLKSIATPKDIGVRASFFQKIAGWITGSSSQAMSRPLSVAVGPQETLYVADPGLAVVHVFNQKEKRYFRWTKAGNESWDSPVGVAAGPEGRVFVSDSKRGRVYCLDKNGRRLFTIGESQSLERPTGLFCDGQTLYVVETAGHRIALYDIEGHRKSEFGKRGSGPGEFNYPTSVAVDVRGMIYVADTLNFRLQAFDSSGTYLYSIGKAGDGSGSFSRPKAVAMDSFGHLYVTDGLFDNVQIFNAQQEFLMSWGESGNKAGEFWIISGIAIDQDNRIYVADSYNQRVQVFQYVGQDL